MDQERPRAAGAFGSTQSFACGCMATKSIRFNRGHRSVDKSRRPTRGQATPSGLKKSFWGSVTSGDWDEYERKIQDIFADAAEQFEGTVEQIESGRLKELGLNPDRIQSV